MPFASCLFTCDLSLRTRGGKGSSEFGEKKKRKSKCQERDSNSRPQSGPRPERGALDRSAILTGAFHGSSKSRLRLHLPTARAFSWVHEVRLDATLGTWTSIDTADNATIEPKFIGINYAVAKSLTQDVSLAFGLNVGNDVRPLLDISQSVEGHFGARDNAARFFEVSEEGFRCPK